MWASAVHEKRPAQQTDKKSDHQDDVCPASDHQEYEAQDEEGSESGGQTVAADADAFQLHEDLLL
jgi:hypothetical protein